MNNNYINYFKTHAVEVSNLTIQYSKYFDCDERNIFWKEFDSKIQNDPSIVQFVYLYYDSNRVIHKTKKLDKALSKCNEIGVQISSKIKLLGSQINARDCFTISEVSTDYNKHNLLLGVNYDVFSESIHFDATKKKFDLNYSIKTQTKIIIENYISR